MYSENRREYEKKVMQIVEERLVLDFFHKKCNRFDSVKSLKPAQVGTILNDMDIFFLRFIKINENFKILSFFLNFCVKIQDSRSIREFDVLNFWNLVRNFPKKVQDGVKGAR